MLYNNYSMEEQDKNNFSWKTIDKYLQEKTESGFKIAIIEANKIFEKSLKDNEFPGKNINEKILIAKESFQDFEKLERARKTFFKIIRKFNYSPSAEETKEILTSYYQAALDIEEARPKKFFQIKKFFKKIFGLSLKKILKRGVIYIIVFFSAVLFLADTETGNYITETTVNITHFFFKKIVPIILIIIALFIIVFGTLFYLEKRRKENRNLLKK